MSDLTRTAVRPAGPGRWTPYRNLVYYAHAVDARSARERQRLMTVQEASARAKRQADVILRSSFVPTMLDPGRPWDLVHPQCPRAGRYVASNAFAAFLSRPTHRSRRALDEISLAYWCAGYDYQDVLARTYIDYRSVGESVMPLELRDVAVFLQFYWNWRIDRDWTAQQGFVDQFCQEKGTSFVADIFGGRASLVDIRMQHGVNLGFDTSSALRRLSRNLLHVAEAGSREINRLRIRKNDKFLKYGGLVQTLSTITGSALAAARAEADIAEAATSSKTLQDYIETELQDDDFLTEPFAVSDLQEIGLSPADLYLENAGGNPLMLAPPSEAGEDDADLGSEPEMPFYDDDRVVKLDQPEPDA